MKFFKLAAVVLLVFNIATFRVHAVESVHAHKYNTNRLLCDSTKTTIFSAFEYADTAGRKQTLNSIKGKKATLVVFWASWCFPCRKEIPALKELYSKYKDKGLSIVSISVDEKVSAWKKAVSQEKMPWVNLADPGKAAGISTKYNLSGVPAMFLLDADNNILLTDPDLAAAEASINQQVNANK
ncbi:hypothetical protein GCM10023149_06930 [Mucilaginibacter gynuensis]|uniref:Thioredoxin domain-containing protein n=1 Tax=Mucilaginibacter gynuensis TaxID=1302236 RepID=A0ABP8FVH5_9SPHI